MAMYAKPTQIPSLQKYFTASISTGEGHSLVLVKNHCFGKQYNDQSVCSRHGKCVAVDKCVCDRTWFGPNCNVTSCNGIDSTNFTHSCSGQGKCYDYDKCECSPAYHGVFCQSYTCNGLDPRNSTGCSLNGQCIGGDSCSCREGYWGKFCDTWACFNHSIHDVGVCNQKGKCVEPNICMCDTVLYIGTSCHIPFFTPFIILFLFVFIGFILFVIQLCVDVKLVGPHFLSRLRREISNYYWKTLKKSGEEELEPLKYYDKETQKGTMTELDLMIPLMEK
jgi:hypothetical protein